MVWYDFLNPVLNHFLKLGPFWAIFLLSFIISLLITLIYKWVTDQELMKRLKGEQKEYQKKLKGLRDNPQEMMKVQKEAMKKNMEYMKQSFKPTLITMLPIILIFGWMQGHLAFEPIYPGETYSLTADFAKGATGKATLIPDKETSLLSKATQDVNSKVNWKVKSKTSGNHILTFKHGEKSYTKKVLITRELAYEEPLSTFQHSDVKSITINYNKLKPLGPNFSIFGWHPGWLGLYIIFSIVMSMALRKFLKIY